MTTPSLPLPYFLISSFSPPFSSRPSAHQLPLPLPSIPSSPLPTRSLHWGWGPNVDTLLSPFCSHHPSIPSGPLLTRSLHWGWGPNVDTLLPPFCSSIPIAPFLIEKSTLGLGPQCCHRPPSPLLAPFPSLPNPVIQLETGGSVKVHPSSRSGVGLGGGDPNPNLHCRLVPIYKSFQYPPAPAATPLFSRL